jgi:hypothetical protein
MPRSGRLYPSFESGQTKGVDHAGEPTGVGLGWIHILPIDSPSHIVEKTGGGAGFETYIAINHSRRTAIFLAATEGSVDTHLNLFNAANKLLLALAGLPPSHRRHPNPQQNTSTLIAEAKRVGILGGWATNPNAWICSSVRVVSRARSTDWHPDQ